MTVMVYCKGNGHKLHGLWVDYKIIDEGDLDAHLDAGYGRSPSEAHADTPAPAPQPTAAPAKRKRRTPAEMAAARAAGL